MFDRSYRDEVCYSVELWGKDNARTSVQTTKGKIRTMLRGFKAGDDGVEKIIFIGHITSEGKPADDRKNEKPDEIWYVRGNESSLVMKVKDEQRANRAAEFFGLPLPFPDYEYKRNI